MKLNVGNYVRTKDGIIAKLIEIRPYLEYGETIETKVCYFDKNIDGYNNGVDFEYAKEIIIQSSPNIIDLIEVGDYVNGLKVIDIVENDIYISDYYAESYIGVVKVKDIKSIVTKEQFLQMEYKVCE